MYLTQGGQIRSRKKTSKRSSKYASKKLNRNKYQKGGSFTSSPSHPQRESSDTSIETSAGKLPRRGSNSSVRTVRPTVPAQGNDPDKANYVSVPDNGSGGPDTGNGYLDRYLNIGSVGAQGSFIRTHQTKKTKAEKKEEAERKKREKQEAKKAGKLAAAQAKQAEKDAKQAKKEAEEKAALFEICKKLDPDDQFNALTNENKKKVVIDTIYYLCTYAGYYTVIEDSDDRSTVPESKINDKKDKILKKYIFSKDTDGDFKIKEGLMTAKYQNHFLNAMIGIIIKREGNRFNENNELLKACEKAIKIITDLKAKKSETTKALEVAKKSETTNEDIYMVPVPVSLQTPDLFDPIAYVVALLYLGEGEQLNKVAFEKTNTDFETILDLFKASDKLTGEYKNAFKHYDCQELIEEPARRNFENYKQIMNYDLAKYFLSKELARLSKLNTQDSSTFSREVLQEQGLYNYKLLLALYENLKEEDKSSLNSFIFTSINTINTIIAVKKTIDYNKLLRDLISVIESNKETLEQLITYDSVCQDFMADQSSSADVGRLVRCLKAVKLFINANDTIISKYTKDLFNLVYDQYMEKIERIDGKQVAPYEQDEKQVSAENTLIISEMLELMVKGNTPENEKMEDYIRKIQALLVDESSLQLDIKAPTKKGGIFSRKKIVVHSKNTTMLLEVHQKVLLGIITICKDILDHPKLNITLNFHYCKQLEEILRQISYKDNFGIQFLYALNDTDTQTSASNIFAKMLGIDDVSFNFLLAQPIDSINLGRNVSKPVNNLRRNGGDGVILDENTITVFEVFLKFLINKFEKSKELYFLSILGPENITRITNQIKELNSDIKVKTISLPNSFILKNVNVDNNEKNLKQKTIGFELLIAHLLDLVNRITINRHLLKADAQKALQMISNMQSLPQDPNKDQYLSVLKQSEIQSIDELSGLFDEMKGSAPIFTTAFNDTDYTKHQAQLATLKAANEQVVSFYKELFSFIPQQLTVQSGGTQTPPSPQPQQNSVFNFKAVPQSPTSPALPTSPSIGPLSPALPTSPTSPLPNPVTKPTQYNPDQSVSVNSLQENKYLLVDIIEDIDQTKLHQFISKDKEGSNTISEQIDNHFDKVYLNVLIYLACYAHANQGTESISRTLDNKNIRMLVDLPEEKARNTEEDQAAAQAKLAREQEEAAKAAKLAAQQETFFSLTAKIEAEIKRATQLNSVAVQKELATPKEGTGRRGVSFSVVNKSREIQGVKTALDGLQQVNDGTIRQLNELLQQISALINEIKAGIERAAAERDAAAAAKERAAAERDAAAAAKRDAAATEAAAAAAAAAAAEQDAKERAAAARPEPPKENLTVKMRQEINNELTEKLSDDEVTGDLTEDIVSKCKKVIDDYKNSKLQGASNLETYVLEDIEGSNFTDKLKAIYDLLKLLMSERAMLLDKVETILVINEYIRKENKYLSTLETEASDTSLDKHPYFTNSDSTSVLTEIISVPILNLAESKEVNVQVGAFQSKMHIFNKGGQGYISLEMENIPVQSSTYDTYKNHNFDQLPSDINCKYPYKTEQQTPPPRLHYSYAVPYQRMQKETLEEVESDNQLTYLDTINKKINANNHVILFVFGITGSGKDTFLNSVYGLPNVLKNPKIHDDETKQDENLISKQLNLKNTPESGFDIKETWYYVDVNDISLKTINNKVANYEVTVKENMRERTPFNKQSTRGFSIKNITNPSKGITTIINVPGFEPLNNILFLHLAGKHIDSKTGTSGSFKAYEIAIGGKIKIGGGMKEAEEFFNVLNDILTTGKIVNIPTNSTLTKKFEFSEDPIFTNKVYLEKVLNQGLFILITLNIMGAILVNYDDINTYIKNQKHANITSEIIFEYIKERYMEKMDVPNISGEISFPISDKLEFLNPFHKNNRKFIYFAGGNPIYENCIDTKKNKFITDLIGILFLQKERVKYRYNINVVRPLRNEMAFLEKEIPSNVAGLTIPRSQQNTSQIKEFQNVTNGGLEKIIMDATLIKTLEGFCQIREADSKTAPATAV